MRDFCIENAVVTFAVGGLNKQSIFLLESTLTHFFADFFLYQCDNANIIQKLLSEEKLN